MSFLLQQDGIDKIIKPEMREEYERDKINFLPSESEELQPTFQVDTRIISLHLSNNLFCFISTCFFLKVFFYKIGDSSLLNLTPQNKA
jgi:hypothetical protein